MVCTELPSYARLDLDVVAASGDELILRDGRRVLDLYGGHCVNTLGAGERRRECLGLTAEERSTLEVRGGGHGSSFGLVGGMSAGGRRSREMEHGHPCRYSRWRPEFGVDP